MEALHSLADERLHLILLGDGLLRDEVEAAAREALGERLTMPGFVNQRGLAAYFAAADVFVLPSAFETWGLVVNEAMQLGLPAIVSSAVGCHADLVIPEGTGMIFPTGPIHAPARSRLSLRREEAWDRRDSPPAREHMYDAVHGRR